MLAYLEMSKCIQSMDVAATSTVPAHAKCAEKNVTKNSKAKAIIGLSIETSIYVHVSNCDTALSMWKTLMKLYEDTGLTRKIGLLRSLIQCRLDESSDMQEYIDKIMSIYHAIEEKMLHVRFRIIPIVVHKKRQVAI